MQPVSWLRRLQRHAEDFLNATRGNIAVTFIGALVPILIFVGAAADYGRVSMARTAMQAALDLTALMLSRDLASGTITLPQLNATAQAYFAALYTNPDAQSVAINVTYTPGSSGAARTILLNGSGAITTDFMNLAGYPTMGFHVSSTTTWGTDLLRIALVLDNTASMNDYNKIGALKTAARTSRHPTLGTRREQRRRLRFRHSVRNRRQCRHLERRRALAALGSLGSQRMALRQFAADLVQRQRVE